MLNEKRINMLLEGLNYRVSCYDQVDSTNLIVKNAVRQGEPEGFVATALSQEGGYGRQGRVWLSPSGGLYFSVLFRPQVSMQRLPTLSLMCASAVRAAIAPFADAPEQIQIKWPNDVICPQGKLCGISLESAADGVCVGVGLNVFVPIEIAHRQEAGESLAGFLSQATHVDMPYTVGADGFTPRQQVFMEDVLAGILHELRKSYNAWKQGGFPAVRHDYIHHVAFMGESVVALSSSEEEMARGIAIDVDNFGRLVIKGPDSTLKFLASGEVHLK